MTRPTYLRGAAGAPHVDPRAALREDIARMQVAAGATTPGLVEVPPSGNVATDAADELIAHAREWAARSVVPGIARGERLARAGAARDAAADLDDMLRLLDVYGAGQHSRLRDVATVLNPRSTTTDRDEAATRLDLHQQRQTLVRQWADVREALGAADPVPAAPLPNPCAWLNNAAYVARPTAPVGRGRLMSTAWANLPAAFVDSPPGTDVSATSQAILAGDVRPWRSAGLAINASMQELAWSIDDGAEVEALIEAAVDLALERALLDDVAADAPTAASFAAAEESVGAAWTAGADLIVCAGQDRPKIIRAYAAEGIQPADRPTILATGGATAGTAVVMASGAVRAEATDRDELGVDEPGIMGRGLAVLRLGLAAVRVPGAVQLVEVA